MTTAAAADEHLKLALGAAAMHTWSWDITSGQVEWSEGIAALVGLGDAFDGTFEAYRKVLHPEDGPLVMAAIQRAVEDPTFTYDIEHRVALASGDTRWLACRGQVLRNEAGAPVSMLGVVWDVTARKTAEARMAAAEVALRASEERKRMIVEQATDGIFLADASMRFVEVNGAGERMLGYGPGELLAVPVPAIFVDLDVCTAFRPGTSGEDCVAEIRMRRKDGTTLDVEISAKCLPSGLWQAFARDIRERKELHARLLRADRLASLGRLAAGVAHEINNPLAYMALNHEIALGKLALLPPGPVAESIRGALAIASEGTDRVRRIVRELASFGRGDEERLIDVDVHRALDGAFAIAENEIRHRARLTRSYRAPFAVRASESHLGQVFVNLLVNAADAIEQGSVDDNEIRIETSLAPDGRVRVEVSDTGVGVGADVIDRVFDPFFTTKPLGVGTGLGMWICHNIVTRLGGEIGIRNNAGRGATVWVLLPAAIDAAATQSPEAERAPSSSGRRARILVVDDEPAIATAIARVLSLHDVTVATGGREAQELATTRVFDCILCDVMMPGIGGAELYASFAKDGRGLERRMVFMTAETFIPRARAFLAGIPNRCLSKPFGRDDLETMVASVLQDAPA